MPAGATPPVLGCLLGPISYTLPRGETSAQIPPRTAGGLGRGGPRIPPFGRERGLESPTGAFVPFGTGQLENSFALRLRNFIVFLRPGQKRTLRSQRAGHPLAP